MRHEHVATLYLLRPLTRQEWKDVELLVDTLKNDGVKGVGGFVAGSYPIELPVQDMRERPEDAVLALPGTGTATVVALCIGLGLVVLFLVGVL